MESVDRILKASDMLKAIAHPLRYAILELLCDQESLCVSDIQKSLNVEQAVVSQHLKILKDKQVLNVRKEGKHVFYEVKNLEFKKMLSAIEVCSNCEEKEN
jgi:ArsR family transcriptional regulator